MKDSRAELHFKRITSIFIPCMRICLLLDVEEKTYLWLACLHKSLRRRAWTGLLNICCLYGIVSVYDMLYLKSSDIKSNICLRFPFSVRDWCYHYSRDDTLQLSCYCYGHRHRLIRNYVLCTKFEVLTAAVVSIILLWYLTPFRWVNRCGRFGRSYCLNFLCKNGRNLCVEYTRIFDNFVRFLVMWSWLLWLYTRILLL